MSFIYLLYRRHIHLAAIINGNDNYDIVVSLECKGSSIDGREDGTEDEGDEYGEDVERRDSGEGVLGKEIAYGKFTASSTSILNESPLCS